MFNGIIYNQGTVIKIIKRPKGLNIFVLSNLKLSQKDIGLSDGIIKINFILSYTIMNLIHLRIII